MQQKCCTGCKKWFPATKEFFDINITHKFGLYSKCKVCVKKYTKSRKGESTVRYHSKNPGAKYRHELKLSDEERKEKRKISKRKWIKKSNYQIHLNINSHINRSLHGTKSKRWEILVGYSLEELKNHLESQFKDGMKWENYGVKGWHIDHVKPKSLFKIVSEDCSEFKECWALSNLQPLWGADNIRKSNHYYPGTEMAKSEPLPSR